MVIIDVNESTNANEAKKIIWEYILKRTRPPDYFHFKDNERLNELLNVKNRVKDIHYIKIDNDLIKKQLSKDLESIVFI